MLQLQLFHHLQTVAFDPKRAGHDDLLLKVDSDLVEEGIIKVHILDSLKALKFVGFPKRDLPIS